MKPYKASQQCRVSSIFWPSVGREVETTLSSKFERSRMAEMKQIAKRAKRRMGGSAKGTKEFSAVEKAKFKAARKTST